MRTPLSTISLLHHPTFLLRRICKHNRNYSPNRIRTINNTMTTTTLPMPVTTYVAPTSQLTSRNLRTLLTTTMMPHRQPPISPSPTGPPSPRITLLTTTWLPPLTPNRMPKTTPTSTNFVNRSCSGVHLPVWYSFFAYQPFTLRHLVRATWSAPPGGCRYICDQRWHLK